MGRAEVFIPIAIGADYPMNPFEIHIILGLITAAAGLGVLLGSYDE